MISSLRLRLMLGAASLAVIFMMALLTALQQAFGLALEETIEQRLAADVSTLISAAQIKDGELQMPDRLPDEEFDLPDAKVLGYIYDRQGRLLWQSAPTLELKVGYRPRYDGRGNELHRIRDAKGTRFFVYDTEIDLLRGESAAYSIVTMQPAQEYDWILAGLGKQLYIWLGSALLVLLALLWLGLTWGFRSLRGVSAELDQVEAGERDHLSDRHPKELLRLTRSLNRLLESERQQGKRYRHTLGDLAHSLKTPLSLLQALGEDIAARTGGPGQVQLLQTQVERMNQQIDFQLQRASLRRSGLVRHQAHLAPLLETLVVALNKVYPEKQVVVLRAFDNSMVLPMEKAALLELLGNLLENAYRLCLSRIRVGANRITEGYELCVEDDGPGVPEYQRVNILRRGERLDTQHPGQGLGLAMVGDIIESYSGTLTLGISDLGGARFRIVLPP